MVVAPKLAFAVAAIVLAALAPGTSASAFLRQKTHDELQQVTREIIERTLLSELAMDSDRLGKFEEELRPMYTALPKNEDGTLDPTAVRYALHRYFVQKHGWYVKGLEPSGQSWNSSAATNIMKSRVPAFIQSLFEERLHGDGMGLHDLSAFAATLSDFVHNEALSDVVDLYSAFGLSTTTPLRQIDVDRVIKAYVLQLLDSNSSITSFASLRDVEAGMIQDFPAWQDFKLWVQDVRQTMSFDRSRRSLTLAEEFTFANVIEEVQELSDRLGRFQDLECRSLKAALTDIEHRGTGRVLLSDFYREGLRGDFLFIEHVDFLRKLGALDEGDAKHPSVIIANYLHSQANCLASTSFHSVCCFDECDGLLGYLERSVAAPSASPGRIAELVGGLRSDTVDAPRNLSASLVSRLGEIADYHDGQVPLHGRLFAQWMHHAYPLECAFPHAAGTTSPLTPDEWMDLRGADEIAAPEALRRTYIKPDMPSLDEAGLPWMAVEELVVNHRPAKSVFSVRKVGALAAILAFAVPLAKHSAAFIMPSQAKSEKCHFV